MIGKARRKKMETTRTRRKSVCVCVYWPRVGCGQSESRDDLAVWVFLLLVVLSSFLTLMNLVYRFLTGCISDTSWSESPARNSHQQRLGVNKTRNQNKKESNRSRPIGKWMIDKKTYQSNMLIELTKNIQCPLLVSTLLIALFHSSSGRVNSRRALLAHPSRSFRAVTRALCLPRQSPSH